MKPRLKGARGPGRRAFPSALALDLGESRLFLGRFDEAGLRRELEREGILGGLRARGYPDVLLRTSFESGEHRLRIRPRGGRTSLVDLRVLETTLVVSEEVVRRGGLEVLSVLFNSWLSLQDPRARFTPERPRLPGQRFPGLGLARAFYSLLARWAREWGKDAVLATPEYFHNAVFYSPAFRFLSPREQGRFLALRRDLQDLPVAEASAAVNAGRVNDLSRGEAFAWRPGPMAAAVGDELARTLDGGDYRRAAEMARAEARFAPRALPSSSALLPAASVAGTQPAQQAKAVDPGVVVVLPGGSERVVADALEVHELLPGKVEVPRGGSVSLAARARTPAAEVVEGKRRDVAVVPGDDEPPRALLVAHLDGLGVGKGSGHADGVIRPASPPRGFR